MKPMTILPTPFILLALAVLLPGCSEKEPGEASGTETGADAPADQIFTGGTIVTMDPHEDSVEAIAVTGGKITAVGSAAEIDQFRGPSTRHVDLAGGTLLPGFIDAHSHFAMAVRSATWVNVAGAPVGKVTSISELTAELKAQHNDLEAGEWVVGYGYDADTLSDGRGLNRDDLDAVFPDKPVVVIHVSFHGAVLNSLAFDAIGYDASTPTPEGGVILRREGSNEPLGLLMETAWFPVVEALPVASGEQKFVNVRLAQEFYAARGVTTAQEGFTSMEDFILLREAARRGDLFIDLVALGAVTELEAFLAEKAAAAGYDGRLKLGGIKIIGDGSPQGKTAFFSKPYLTGGPGGEEDWYGEPVIPQAAMDKLLATIYGAGLRAFVHANGDAAVDSLLNAHEKSAALTDENSRTVVIHSQFMRPEQLEDYLRFGMVPSFFSNHAFFWGDVHVKNLGEKRAYFLSPMKSAASLGIHFTNHSDYAVTPLDPLFGVWSAVNRTSRSGQVIGEAERITPYQALRAITIDGAWQYGEENSKGSISVGKLADLVLLSDNPLTVKHSVIKDIEVLVTYKEGVPIFNVDGGSSQETVH